MLHVCMCAYVVEETLAVYGTIHEIYLFIRFVYVYIYVCVCDYHIYMRSYVHLLIHTYIHTFSIPGVVTALSAFDSIQQNQNCWQVLVSHSHLCSCDTPLLPNPRISASQCSSLSIFERIIVHASCVSASNLFFLF